MQISVIIPVYNGGREFQRCLDALHKTSYSQWELIVIDDGSTDGSAQLAESKGARLIRSLQPRSGPAVARNLGAQAAQGSILFFLDADVLVRPNTVGDVVTFMQSEPGVSALFGSYDDSPTAATFLSQYRNLQHHYVHQVSSFEAYTFWSGCGAIRREVFLVVGGFDTDTYPRPSIEDIELGYRLRDAGHRIHLLKSLQVTHMKRWTARQVLLTDIRDRAYPWSMLILRKGSAIPHDLNLAPMQRLSAMSLFLALGTLSLSPFYPVILTVTGIALSVLIFLNFDFYRYLNEKRGTVFLLRSLPWHWLYFLYSGLVFAFCTLKVRFFRTETEESGSLSPTV